MGGGGQDGFQQISPLLVLLLFLLPGFPSQSTADPVFDTRIPTEVSTVLGETAALQCRVFQRKNLTVSWLRQDTLHILSAGHYTYVSDARYEAAYMKREDLWELRIKNVEEKDSGLFECQVSSLPVISYFIQLNVLVPHADIEGDPDLYVQAGSSINLTCVVNHLPERRRIRWKHKDSELSHRSLRGDGFVSILTELGSVSYSCLVIRGVGPDDGGSYSCLPGNISPANITVHVLKGEEPSQLYGSSLSLADLALPFTSLLLLLSIVSGLAVLARNTLVTPPLESTFEGMVVMQ